MKKAYESTVEEAVAVNWRLVEILGIAARGKWVGIPIMILVPFLMFGIFLSSPLPVRFAVAAVVSIAGIGIFLVLYKDALRRNVRRHVVKFRGGEQPIAAEFELNDSGVVFRQLGRELRSAWSNVKEVAETERAIEIVMDPPGVAMIPKRIFDTRTEIDEWIRFLRERMESKTGNESLEPRPNAHASGKSTDE